SATCSRMTDKMYLEGFAVFTAGLVLGALASQRYNLPKLRALKKTVERLKEIERKHRRAPSSSEQ
ncbi:hypothetical protein Bpfe_025594, partial [Biomphalaria pfeifferi]